MILLAYNKSSSRIAQKLLNGSLECHISCDDGLSRYSGWFWGRLHPRRVEFNVTSMALSHSRVFRKELESFPQSDQSGTATLYMVKHLLLQRGTPSQMFLYQLDNTPWSHFHKE